MFWHFFPTGFQQASQRTWELRDQFIHRLHTNLKDNPNK